MALWERERAGIAAAAVLGVAMWVLLYFVVSPAKADDSAYLRARAAIAINASVAKTGGTDAAPSPVKTAKPPAKSKPEIWTFYAPFHCDPCDAEKADLKEWKDAPFAFRNGDINNAPVMIESYPTTAWQVDGKWWSYSGWHGTEHLEREWKRSQSKASHTSAGSGGHAGTLTQAGSLATRRYTWPGDLRHHLRTTHGITESLTHEQAVMVHDAIHSGYSVAQIRAWARARGMIK